jgi:carboxylesterase
MPDPYRPGMPTAPAGLMPGAEPIFIDQGEKGLLFFHGFTGSPYEGRELSRFFANRGYGVWVPLLPGHGTRPADLQGISHQAWLEAAEQFYLSMKKQYREVFVCGQSMGGALALYIAAKQPLKAFATLAAAVFIRDWRLPFLPVARRVLDYYYKSKGPDISDPAAKARSASYPRYPLDSLQEFLTLIETVRIMLPSITAPALLAHSRRDHTITYENLSYIAANLSSTQKEILTLEKSYHVISVDRENEQIFQAMDRFINRYMP